MPGTTPLTSVRHLWAASVSGESRLPVQAASGKAVRTRSPFAIELTFAPTTLITQRPWRTLALFGPNSVRDPRRYGELSRDYYR